MDQQVKLSGEPQARDANRPCALGQAWTCTVQCEEGTRAPVERLFGAPGAEVCVVAACACAPRVAPTPEGIADPTLPLALVVFGLRHLVLGR